MPDVVADGERPGRTLDARPSLIRLSEHAYWLAVERYQCTVVVGTQSALVLDPMSGGRGTVARAVVRDELGLAISAVAYSHHHPDHISDAAALADEPLDVVATAECARRVRSAPEVTHVLADGEVFEFQGVRIEARVVGGHSSDLTWFRLVDDDVLHLVDVVHPTSAEFDSFGMPASMSDYVDALDTVLATPWRVMNAGHAELGWRHDVQTARDYISDAYATTSRALASHPTDAGFTEPYARLAARLGEVTAAAGQELASRWHQLAGIGAVARSHAHRIAFELLWYDERLAR